MALKSINQSNILFLEKNILKYDSYEKGNINIILDIPILSIPFGLEEGYGKFEIKFELNDKCDHLYNIFDKIEKEMKEKLDVGDRTLHKTIRGKKPYKDLLTVRIPYYKNTFLATIKSKNDDIHLPTMFDLYKNVKASAKIHIKKYWIIDDKYGFTPELKSITIH